MKKFTKIMSFCMAALILILAVLPLGVFAAEVESDVKSFEASYTVHNFDDNAGYYPSSSNKVTTLASGHTRLGKLTVKGSNIEQKNYQGYEAYAVKGGDISFEYKQSWSNKNYDGHDWYLSSDSATSIAGYGTGTIGDGGILILKSTDEGATWSKAATSVSINGETVTFTPSGEDIGKGVLLKFISVQEAYYTYKSGSHRLWYTLWIKEVDDYSDHYENFAQVSTVYVASDSAQISFYSKATDNYDLSSVINDVSAEDLEIIRKGTTLSNNSISFNQIRVDKLGNKSFDVTCSYNDSSYFTVEDGAVFTNPGHYTFKITTKFLTQREVNLWILDPNDDYAYSQYFGSSFVNQSKRIFDAESQLPVYMVGTTLNISPAAYVPGLSGNIIRYEDATAVEKDEYETIHTLDYQTTSTTIELARPGVYCADLFVGDVSASGEIIHYGFYFFVVDDPEYKPSVNLNLLTSSDRHVMLETTAYSVNFATAGGGSYIFNFPATKEGYDDALAFSEEIEYRFIEEYTDASGKKYYYYKAHGTSGLKQRFDSKVELFESLTAYAKENVNRTYSNNTESYATMSLEEAVEKVETTSITRDIKVCVDTETRNRLVSDDIIVNGFRYYQVAVYESASVTMTAEDGTVYDIPYDVPVEDVLPGTGRYLVTETNWNGVNSYYVNFLDNEVTGEVVFEGYKDCEKITGIFSSENTAGTIEANRITLKNASDVYDSQTILTVSTIGYRENMLLTEVDDFTISTPGTYCLTLTNRCGFTTSTILKITESPKTYVKFEGYEHYDYKLSFGEKLGELPQAELAGHDFLYWTANGVPVTAETECTWTDEVVLTPCFSPKTVKVILNYFNGYTTLDGDFGSTLELPNVDNIENLFAFGYWELDGEAVDALTIDSLDTIVLVAKYYKMDEDMNVLTTTAYSSYEIVPLLSMSTNTPTNNSTLANSSPTDEAFNNIGNTSSKIDSVNTLETDNVPVHNYESVVVIVIVVAVVLCTFGGLVLFEFKKRRS